MSESIPPANACPRCGAALPSAATKGLCPRCLMAEAMAPTQGDAEPAVAQATLTPEELAPHFPQLEILECLGRGGMGVVYKARQKTLNRLVALKLLAPERVTDAKFAERFTDEAQALAALNHPNIVTVYDFGQAGGFYYLLMEFVDGVNLRQAMKAGRFTPEQALAVVPPVCEALQYAHEHGIVHRDIKPENLLLDKTGRIKIADFGIAKILGAPAADGVRLGGLESGRVAVAKGETPASGDPTLASVAGTPQYMAPEQKAHRVADHRADIYSLGVVLYELLTGELPTAKLELPSSRLRGVQIDVRLDEIVLRALEKSPELRYQTAGEFRAQVETIVAEPGEGRGEERSVASGGGKPGVARFSRTAIVAAAWITLSVVCLPPFIWHEVKTHEFMTHGPFGSFLMALVFFVSLLPCFVAPLGATLLGWIAVTQIRRSEGKLDGLWLAVFDGLFFPILALDAALAWILGAVIPIITRSLIDPSRYVATPDGAIPLHFVNQWVTVAPILLPPTVLTALVVDYLIIGKVWRAVNRSSDRPGATPPRGQGGTGLFALGCVAIAFAVLSGVFGIIVWSRLPHPPHTMVSAALLAAVLAVLLGAVAWRRPIGKGALIVGAFNLAIWLIVAGLSHPSRPFAPVQTKDETKLTFGPVIDRVLPDGVPCREQYFQFRRGKVFIVGNGPGTSAEEAAYDWKKVEEAGGIDFSAGSSAEGVSLVGRGCIFTRDVEGLSWDGFTAEKAVKAMDNASFVAGVEEPRKLEFPITYLFKTARGEIGLIEVLGAVEDDEAEHDPHYKGYGTKFRYKLVQGAETKVAGPASQLVFGPETHGLQAAVEVIPGEPFHFRFHIRNVSDRAVSIEGSQFRQEDDCLLENERGQRVEVVKVKRAVEAGMHSGYFGGGQVAIFDSGGLSFAEIDRSPFSASYVAKGGPGRYTLHFRIHLPGADAPFAPNPNAWHGDLETAPVTIDLPSLDSPPKMASAKGPVTVAGELVPTSFDSAAKWVCRVRSTEVGMPVVSAGQPAQLTLPAFPGRTFIGKLRHVFNSSGNASNEVTYEMVIDVVDPDPGFKAEMPANVTFGGTQEAASASAAPRPSASNDPTSEIEMKVAQEQLEKTLTELQEAQTELAVQSAKKVDDKGEIEPERQALEARVQVLQEQSRRLREAIHAGLR